MRSLFTRTGTAAIAAAALFAVVAMPSTANAFTFRAHDLTATGGPEAVQKVAITRSEARQARRDVARAVRDDCRLNNTGRERGRCFRETYRDLRTEARTQARTTYQDCRDGDGSRRECRQAARQAAWSYWYGQAYGSPTDEPAAGGGGFDDATSEVPTDDLPM